MKPAKPPISRIKNADGSITFDRQSFINLLLYIKALEDGYE
jgi:hypothetical protein